MKIIQKHTKINVAIFLVILTGIVLLAGKIYFYTIHGDDPWFAEQAYWLAKDGVVRSEFFSSVLDYGARQFAYHKLHIWIAALAIKIFGLSFMSLKLITLTFFGVFLLVSYKYFRAFHQPNARDYFRVFLAFYLINSLVIELVFVYRPEIAMMCLGFVSYYFLRKTTKQDIKSSILAGGFAGLCALLHLNGVIFIVAGFILLLSDLRYKSAVWFGIAASLVASLYFIDILPGHWAEYWYQFRHDPAIPASQFSLSTLLGRILFEYDRFFGHGYESGYSLLLLVVLIARYKAIWTQVELRSCLIYFLALTFTLAAVSPGKTHYDLLFAMPYAGILVSVSLWQILSEPVKKGKRRTLTGFAILYVLANIPHALAIISDGLHHGDRVQENAGVMEKYDIKPGDKVLAPLEFIFNALEKVNIHGVDAYFMRVRLGKVQQSAGIFFQQANADDRKFILLNHWQREALRLQPVIGETYFDYTYLGAMSGYDVFRKSTSGKRAYKSP